MPYPSQSLFSLHTSINRLILVDVDAYKISTSIGIPWFNQGNTGPFSTCTIECESASTSVMPGGTPPGRDVMSP